MAAPSWRPTTSRTTSRSAAAWNTSRRSGTRAASSPSLLYGPGTSAFSVTITPTFTYRQLFLRGEYAHVELYDITPGFGFGRSGTRTGQDRFMLEAGITF